MILSLSRLCFQWRTFIFVGAGSDTISIAAKTYPAEGFVGDLSIAGSPAPEPSTSAMMLLGFAGLGFGAIASARNSRAQLAFGSGAGVPCKKAPRARG